MTEKKESSRREFLQRSAAALPIIPLAASADAAQDAPDASKRPKELPEEFWRDRMQSPDDGKNYGWFIDTRRCFGCHACEVSCKAENDVPLGHYIRQTIYKDAGEYPKVARMFLPVSCQHCEDAPCIKVCPCGALHKEAGGTVAVDYNTCCGHGSCVEACPYGAIYLDPVAKQAVKCHNCFHRTEQGLEPACVPTCPAQAIHFGDLNDENSAISQTIEQAKQDDIELTQLRADKQTKPRMWFAGPAPEVVEPSVPKEGQSLNSEAYSIHNWRKES